MFNFDFKCRDFTILNNINRMASIADSFWRDYFSPCYGLETLSVILQVATARPGPAWLLEGTKGQLVVMPTQRKRNSIRSVQWPGPDS